MIEDANLHVTPPFSLFFFAMEQVARGPVKAGTKVDLPSSCGMLPQTAPKGRQRDSWEDYMTNRGNGLALAAFLMGAVSVSVSMSVAGAGSAQAQEDVANFYRGKNIQMIVGSSAGGGYDLYGRLVARAIGKLPKAHSSPIRMWRITNRSW
jgi:hypothetical protein